LKRRKDGSIVFTVAFPPELAGKVREAAKLAGKAPEDWIVDCLNIAFAAALEAAQRKEEEKSGGAVER
jgi:hypothetical protein